MELKPFDTINSLGNATGISVYALRLWVHQGKLPFLRSGKKILVNTREALRILEEESKKPVAS